MSLGYAQAVCWIDTFAVVFGSPLLNAEAPFPTAYACWGPALGLVGQIRSDRIGKRRGEVQELLDQTTVLGGFLRWKLLTLRRAIAGQYIGTAIDTLANGLARPAVVELLPDVLGGRVTRKKNTFAPMERAARLSVSPAQLNRAVESFRDARAPLIEVGRGATAPTTQVAELEGDSAAELDTLFFVRVDLRTARNARRRALLYERRAWAEDALRTRLASQMSWIDATRRAPPKEEIMVLEHTQIGYVAASVFPVQHPGKRITPSYQGTFCFGGLIALSVRSSFPEGEVISMSGDSGCIFTVTEPASGVYHRLGLSRTSSTTVHSPPCVLCRKGDMKEESLWQICSIPIMWPSLAVSFLRRRVSIIRGRWPGLY